MPNIPFKGPVKAMPQETRLEAFKRVAPTPKFGRYYVICALLILVASTIFWSVLSARVHQGNADQLVNSYMFENQATLKGALFPGQHTYLLKWPFFWLVHLFGETIRAYQAVTALVAALTVLLFAMIIHKIERRPLVFGTLMLAFASILMFIPAQPYPGGLLPVNMGMIANRNLEYVLFIFSLYAIIRAHRLKCWQFAGGVLGLSILMATDKLFLSISFGGAIAAFVTYALVKKWNLVTIATRWFVASLAGALGMFIIIGIISASNLTNVIGSGSGPYGFISTPHQLVLAVSYAITGLLTNFGANPAYDTTYLSQMPKQALHNLLGLGGPILLLNLGIFITAGVASLRILLMSLGKHKIKNYTQDSRYMLAILMIWASVATLLAFIVSDHYYAGDSRYLTMVMFGLFIGLATMVRGKVYVDYKLALTGITMVGVMVVSVPAVRSINHIAINASSDIAGRNSLVAQALSSHSVGVLVGDYWRVIPIRQVSDSRVNVMPLDNCTQARSILSSLAWQPDLENTSFAYLLSLDQSRTDYPKCSIDEVVTAYGKPNASVVIAGKLDAPDEMILFYDHGAHKSATPVQQVSSAVVTPIPLEELPNTVCANPTKLNIVAHEDDDLLFMNPDVLADIKSNYCVRTVYITAGDAGSNQFYWLGREQGSEAAYSKMIGSDAIWINRTVKLGDNRFITVANPRGNNRISLIFLRLPDGNLRGEGFGASNNQSLQKLYEGHIPRIDSVYGQSSFSKDELVSALESLMHAYQPAEIRTQATHVSTQYPDHSDHITTSSFATEAHAKYESVQYDNAIQIPFLKYIGYPIHAMEENVSGTELEDKTSIFLEYGKHDGGVCHSAAECTPNTAYGSYLRRKYNQ